MLEQLAMMSIAFVGAFLLAKLAISLKGSKAPKLLLTEGAKLKVLTPSGAYRCTVEATDKQGIYISAPIYRETYVPLRLGETVVVQVAHSDGLQTFQTKISDRNTGPHMLKLEWPKHFRISDRRSSIRVLYSSFEDGSINNEKTKIIDLGAMGTKMVTGKSHLPGDWVRVQLPDGYGETYGWILDTTPSRLAGLPGHVVRIRFESPISIQSLRPSSISN